MPAVPYPAISGIVQPTEHTLGDTDETLGRPVSRKYLRLPAWLAEGDGLLPGHWPLPVPWGGLDSPFCGRVRGRGLLPWRLMHHPGVDGTFIWYLDTKS